LPESRSNRADEGLVTVKWLVEEISSNYQVPKKRVNAWLHSAPCPVVLILDGLDEVPLMEDRIRCVRGLSAARGEFHAGIVVASRLRRVGHDFRFMHLTFRDYLQR
jgi:hypothetical protein